jgi:uncharacterized protein YpiB (UPF0302 family)
MKLKMENNSVLIEVFQTILKNRIMGNIDLALTELEGEEDYESCQKLKELKETLEKEL